MLFHFLYYHNIIYEDIDSIHTALYLSKNIKTTYGHCLMRQLMHLSVLEMYCSFAVLVTMIKSCIWNVISYSLLMVLFQWHGSVLFNNKWHCQHVLLILCFCKSFAFTLVFFLKILVDELSLFENDLSKLIPSTGWE